MKSELDKMDIHLKHDEKGSNFLLVEKQRAEQVCRELEKENRIITSELQLLEDEQQRHREESTELRGKVKKLEKMVYGRKK